MLQNQIFNLHNMCLVMVVKEWVMFAMVNRDKCMS